MIGTYASAGLICAASLLVGRAVLSLSGRRSWSWLEPAVGFAAVLTVTGVLARAPGHATTATIGLVALLLLAVAVVARLPYEASTAWREGLPVAVVLLLALSIPFAVNARWGLLGVGINNDLGLHLAWAEWLRSGFGPAPDTGYPLGPHGLADATAALPGIGLGQAFVGEIIAISVLSGLTALAALRHLAPGRRTLAASLVALPYLAASYFAQAAFKETAEALFVLATAVGLLEFERRRMAGLSPLEGVGREAGRWGRARLALPPLALAGGIFFSYSFVGLAWPLAIAARWSLNLPSVRRALRPPSLLRFLLRPATMATILVLAGLAALATTVGPFGFASSVNKVAASNTYGPVSPIEALGIWPTPNYRLDAAGGAQLTGLAGAIGILALAVAIPWWLRRREFAIPLALGVSAVLYALSLLFSGDYSSAKALMILAPLAMLVAVRPPLEESGRAPTPVAPGAPPWRIGRWAPWLNSPPAVSGRRPQLRRLAWSALAAIFVGAAAYSSFLALREAPVGPPGHGGELKAFLPRIHGEPVLYAGQDRYAAYNLLGADTHVPLVEFPDPAVAPNPEKPFDTGDAYSPIDFDSFSQGTLNRFRSVITSRAPWNSQAPENYRRVAVTPSYVLWRRTGPTPPDRHVLLEGTEAAARAGCAAPEIRILLSNPGRASLFPAAAIGTKAGWVDGSVLGAGDRTSQTLDLAAGAWSLSLQYFSPFDLTLSAPGFRRRLEAALDGQRPNTISLASDGQFWPAGSFRSDGGRIRFRISTAEPGLLQRLSGYDGKAYLGELVASVAEPQQVVPLGQACGGWLDWYRAGSAPAEE
jgi:hypothetical protein